MMEVEEDEVAPAAAPAAVVSVRVFMILEEVVD
jgi:hypothetical protein